jgi:uncharacterized protein
MKPKSAYIFVTNKCNLRCKYCYEENRTGDMTPETMIAAIDWLVSHYEKEMFARPFESLTFTFFGGEPLLNFPTVRAGIDYLRGVCDKLNFRAGIHILSNGTVLTDEMTNYFKSIRPYSNFNWHFQVSLDGCEETHNANRVFTNDEGSYKVISENIKKIREIFKSVGVRMTVTPENIKSLSKDFEALLSFGTPVTNLTPIVEGDWNDEVISAFIEELKKCVELYYQKGHNQYFNYLHHSLERIVDNSFNRQKGCRAGEYLIGISTEGNIYPCHRFVAYSKKYDFCLGDVWKGIDEDGEAFKKIKEMRQKAVKCLNCKGFSCNRCFATNMYLNQDPAAIPDNGYCEMNEKISSALRPIIRRLLVEGKLSLKEGEMADLKDKGVMYKISKDEPAELVEDKLDVMARCMIRLVKELQDVKKELSLLTAKPKD